MSVCRPVGWWLPTQPAGCTGVGCVWWVVCDLYSGCEHICSVLFFVFCLVLLGIRWMPWHQVVFRLTKWSWQIHTRFHESRTTRAPHPHHTPPVRLHDSHALRSDFPDCSTPSNTRCDPPAEGSDMAPQHQTRNGRRLSHASGLASSAFARHYSRNIFSCGY